MQRPFSSTGPVVASPQPPPVAPSYMVPSYDASPQPPPVQYSQAPSAYVPNRPSQAPPPSQSGHPHHAPSTQPPTQHHAQPSFPPHFTPPTRGLPAPPLVMQRSSVMPAARSSRPASAFPAPAEDAAFAPDVADPPPNLIAACVFLGGPLVLATMAVAVLALR